jgi:hypothetical protein
MKKAPVISRQSLDLIGPRVRTVQLQQEESEFLLANKEVACRTIYRASSHSIRAG